MAIYIGKFTQIPNDIFDDNKISNGAKICWYNIKSKPPGWRFSSYRMTSEIKGSADAIQRWINELFRLELIKKIKNPNGTIEYQIIEKAKPVKPCSGSEAKPVKPCSGSDPNPQKARQAKSQTGKLHSLSNIDLNSNIDLKEFKEKEEKENISLKSVSKSVVKADCLKYDLIPGLDRKLWHQWIESRWLIGKPYKTSKGLNQALNRLKTLKAESGQSFEQIINYTMDHEWQEFYCDKSKTKQAIGKNEKFYNDDSKNEKYAIIIQYLNTARNKKFNPRATKDRYLILIDNGYKDEDFMTVIDNMIKAWTGTKFEQYLQPKTLFKDPESFDSYLNKTFDSNQEDVLQDDSEYF